MNLNKTLCRVATALVAGAMLTALAMPAYAAGVTTGTETEPVTSVTITKTVETDGNTYAPNTTFNFTVTEGGEKSFNDGTSTVTAKAGVPGGLVAGNGAAFAPVTKEDEKVVAPSVSYTATATLTVDDSVFKKPGIYHYVVTENNLPDNDSAYEGITKDSSAYDVYLYVYNNANYTDLYVGHVVTVKDGKTAKSDLSFTNNYGAGTNDSTHDVTVTKTVAGNQGDQKNDEFNFNVDVNGANGEAYKVVVDYDSTTTNADKDQTLAITSNADPVTVTIKHNGKITIYGLSATDTYTIEETTGADAAGYTVDNNKSNDKTGKVTGQTTRDGESYIVTNTKTATTPTGIVMNVAPYVLLVVVAAAGCFVFLRKRRED